jgi:type VI secretion system FHA domain protein
MNLVLEVVGQNAQSLASERRKVFGVGGGSIGRAPECDWVLASPYISRHHATVCCINGTFYIESTGDNGVAVNTPQAVLPQLERRALKSGDRLFIDEYEISVGIAGGESALDVQSNDTPEPAAEALPTASDELDPLKKLTARGSQPTAPRQEAAWNHTPSLADHFTPPAVPARPLPIAEDWNETDFTPATKSNAAVTVTPNIPQTPPVPQPVFAPPAQQTAAPPPVQHSLIPPAPQRRGSTPSPPHETPDAAAFDLQSLLRNSGVDPASVSPEMAAALGRIFRSLVQGLIEVLRARAEFRNQFRLPVTRVRSTENNPLKFAINAEDALGSLLGRRNPGYMPATEAFEDAFNDVRFHQVAMIAGMRAGFASVMNRFDPQKLQERFDRQLKSGGFLAVAGKLRYWDLYTDLFDEMAGDQDVAFQQLFGEEFATAYEKQLEALKRTRL